tara:strand:- start:819 stop:1109 length:291 start_codon:yes stop_codon:yes gene_type:complete
MFYNGLGMVSANLKNKIMIDKKELIEELLDCVQDATDTETRITGMTMCAILMNEVIDQALTIPVVVSSCADKEEIAFDKGYNLGAKEAADEICGKI